MPLKLSVPLIKCLAVPVLGILFLLTPGLAWAQQPGVAYNQDVPIYYETFGSGSPILIINGGPGMNSKGFRQIGALLAINNQTIIYDQRGTGNSTLTEISQNTITMELMAKDIEALRNHLGFESWVVFGHSFGGIMASYYASKFPQVIDGLILSASGGLDLDLLSYVGQNITNRLTQKQRSDLSYWTSKLSAGDTTYNAKLQRGMALAPAYVQDTAHVPVIAGRLTQGNWDINGLVFQDLQRIQYDCSEKLRSFSKPVLIIQGKQDIIEERTALRAHAVFQNSQLILLDSCGHYGWLDQKEAYLSAVYGFLEQF